MKQPKHFVRLWAPRGTSSGRIQIGFLKFPNTPPWPDSTEDFEVPPALPIEYSSSTGLITPMKFVEVPIERISEWTNLRVSGTEHGVNHVYADGDVWPFCGMHFVNVDSQPRLVWDPNIGQDVWAKRKGYVLSGDVEDIIPIPRYQLGTSDRIGSEEPLWASYEQSYDGEPGRTLFFAGQGRILQCSMTDSPSAVELWSVTALVPSEFSPLTSEGYAEIPMLHEFYQGIALDFTSNVVAETVMVTPMINCSVLTPSREHWLKERSTFLIFKKADSLSETRDAESEFQACYSALKNLREFSINGLEFIKDMSELKKLVTPLISLVKAPLSPRRWAEFLLSYKWGWKTGYEDMRKLYEFMLYLRSPKVRKQLRRSLEKLHSEYGTSYNVADFDGLTVECRYNSRVRGKLIYPVDWLDLDVVMNALGFSLNASNLWDMVPFSFIIDWLVSIQGLCEKVDLEADKSLYLHIQDHVFSQHYAARCTEIEFSEGELLYTCNLSLEKYVRDVSASPTTTPWGLVSKYRSWWKHLGEVTLLVLANRK